MSRHALTRMGATRSDTHGSSTQEQRRALRECRYASPRAMSIAIRMPSPLARRAAPLAAAGVR